MGKIITFYSYKGGVGRTMALANVAVLLAQWDYRVLIVDWDLEAPGLVSYFKKFIDQKAIASKKGLIDLINSYLENSSENGNSRLWEDLIIPIELPNCTTSLDLITSGRQDDDYFRKVINFNIPNFYSDKKGGKFIESLRNEWKESYDLVLIDSRTGITDIGGICTVQLPDMIVLFFTANDQSLNGVIDTAKKVRNARQKLPIDRTELLSIPIPSRFDTQAEFEISQDWLDRFSINLEELYLNWLPEEIECRQILELTKIPYISYFSFGEKLPVLEQGTNDPVGMGYAFENLAALLALRLEQVDLFVNNRDEFINIASKKSTKSDSKVIKSESKVFVSQTPAFLSPHFQYDIFISYSEEDDRSAFDEDKGWVTKFHESLEILLESRFNQEIKIWRGSSIQCGQHIDQTIQKKIHNSAIFLALTSTGFLQKNYCLQELKWFYDKSKKEPHGIQIGKWSRIINVLINNIPLDSWPKEFDRILAHNFYESENENDLGWPLERNSIEFKKQLKRLVDYIYQTLIEFKRTIIAANGNGKENLAILDKEEKVRIFFADVSETLRQSRALAISKLNQKGFSIVTNIPPPYKSNDHEPKVISEIQNSLLSVHLLDEFPGAEIEDEPGMTYRRKQLEIGKKYAKSQLIWVPKNLDFQAIEDDNYKNWLQSLEQGNRRESSYEFIKGSKALLADEIIAKVERLQSQSKMKEISATVLIDAHLKDQTYAIDLCQFLIERNIQPLLLPQLNTPQINLGTFEYLLKQVNAYIILYGQVHENWVRERLAIVLQLYATNKLTFKFFGIFLAPPAKDEFQAKFDFGVVKTVIIDNSKSDKPDISILDSALQKLRVGA